MDPIEKYRQPVRKFIEFYDSYDKELTYLLCKETGKLARLRILRL